jgi:hypothetical protein
MFALCITNITFPTMSSKTKVHGFLDQLTSEAGIAFAEYPPLVKRITDFIGTYQSDLERLFGRPEIKTYEEFMEVLCDSEKTPEQSFVDAGMPMLTSRRFRNLCRAIAYKQNMDEFVDVMEESVDVPRPDPDDVLSFGSSVPSEGDLVSSVGSVNSYDSRGSDNLPGGKKRKRTHRRKCKGSKRHKSHRRHTRRSKH